MSETPSLGTLVPYHLKRHGVETVFGIPGVHNVELYRGLAEAGLRHILVRHEQGAGFLADGYARASGKPGVCFVISGPGLTNIMTPMGQAWSDSVPLLVISAVLPRVDAGKGRGRLHEMRDQQGAAATVCAWSETADSPDAAFELIDRAFHDFAMRRPRPIHIQIPLDVLLMRTSPPKAIELAASYPVAPPENISRIAQWLSDARRPVLVLGGGAKKAGHAVRDILGKVAMPVIATAAGKGIVDDDDPWSLGCCLPRPDAHKVLKEADLVLAVGTELAETDYWYSDLRFDGRLVRIDIDPHILAGHFRADLAVLADATATLAQIANAIDGARPNSSWKKKEVADTRARFHDQARQERPGIWPVIEVIRKSLPDDALIASDMTEIAYLANELFSVRCAGSWLHPSGFGTLGYGLPAGIGAKFAEPDRAVAVLVGDYGFHYTMHELGTAVEHNLPIPIILWDNGKLREIEQDMLRKQIPPNAVVAHNPDFLKLAESFGCGAVQPDDLTGLGKVIKKALRANGPTLIRVVPGIAGD